MKEPRPPMLERAVTRGFVPLRGRRAAQLLAQGRLSGPMPWVIAIMVALTVVAAAGGLALTNLATGARAELAGGATVQIVEAGPAERERQAATVERLLAADPRVADVRRVPTAEVERLLEPWLGAVSGADAVPVPALIDLRLHGSADPSTLTDIQQALLERAPDARVDAQAGWLQPVFAAIRSLQWLALTLVVLLAITSACAVWLAARSALGVNRSTIEVVHLLGGTDGQIARIFQRSVGTDALLGSLVGLALGLATVIALGTSFADLGAGMTAGAGLALRDWLLLALVPIGAILIAIVTARVTVLTALGKML